MTVNVSIRNNMTSADEADLLGLTNDLISTSGGIVNTGDMAVSPSSGLTVSVAAGVMYTYISSLTSLYRVVNTGAVSLTHASNSSGSTRIDIICVKFDPAATPDPTASNVASLLIVQGTPGAGVPATPANHYKLAEVTVTNGAASISGGNITDSRSIFTLASGLTSGFVTPSNTVTMTNKTLTSPKIGTTILDTNGNEVLDITPTASAVNELEIVNAATGNAPKIRAKGDDANIDFEAAGKGTGKFKANTTYGDITSDADAATITLDCSVTNRHEITPLAGNRTLALSNYSKGQFIIVDIPQDGTGSRTITQWPQGPALTVTMTIASPCVVTSLDIPTGTPVIITTSGALPTGLTAGTVYYWIRTGATTGNLASSFANAQAGTAINTSGTQSGTHTMKLQVRWPNQTAPVLSTGKYFFDTISFSIKNAITGLIFGYTSGQAI